MMPRENAEAWKKQNASCDCTANQPRAIFSAMLLAGGKSTRMGCDKAFMPLGSVALWQRQIETLRVLEPNEIFISGPAREEWHDIETIRDSIPNAGPLGGIAAGLRRCESPLLLVLAVDMPRMNVKFLHSLIKQTARRKGIVPRLGNRFEPLSALYPVEALSLAEKCLTRQQFSMQHFAREALVRGLLREREIFSPEEILFSNLNNAADVANFANREQ
jgi:molybdopterin-guanine dinucleotide biosynthesis protein A